MFDIHNHILFGLDDGAKDEETTYKMLTMAYKDGIKTIVATPHYIVGANKYDINMLKERYNYVNSIIKDKQLSIQLILGQELYVDIKLPELLLEKQCLTLGETKYVLIEFPLNNIPYCASYVLYKLMLKGYRPIIAHPERYIDVLRNPNIVYEWIENGCLIQINTSSITGLFGEGVQRTSRRLILNNMVHFVGSDAHSLNKRTPILTEAYESVKTFSNESLAKELFYDNPKMMLNNDLIKVKTPIKVELKKKKKKFTFIRKILLNLH